MTDEERTAAWRAHLGEHESDRHEAKAMGMTLQEFRNIRQDGDLERRRYAMDWADLKAAEVLDDFGEWAGLTGGPKEVAAALRAAKQAGVDEERARCLRIASTVRAGHQAIFERPAVEALDNVIDLIEDGK